MMFRKGLKIDMKDPLVDFINKLFIKTLVGLFTIMIVAQISMAIMRNIAR